MGLLTQFDLDFVMTSEREWGCYAELPGLAIANLARRDGIDAVHVTSWNWDGNRREQISINSTSSQPSTAEPDVETELVETEQSSLF